ncbi:unnamed protein product [Prunus armeniaca]
MVGNISPQAWSVRIPIWGADNESKLVRILRGQDSTNIPLLDGVMHVTTQVATEILELNAGLNALLFSMSLEASIRRLWQEIEFRSKVKDDILRKGKTKIVVAQEHEEDEEEEEEQEDEEDEVGDEDEAVDKGNEDAEPHSTSLLHCITIVQLPVCNANSTRLWANSKERKREAYYCIA